MSDIWLTRTAAQAAVQRSLANTTLTIVKHGTVVETDIGTFIHRVMLDEPGSIVISTHDVTHNGVSVGDRVTVLFAPPHQALIIGSPAHDPWHVVGANGQVPFATNWGNDNSVANALDNNGYPHTMFRREGRMVMVRGTAARSSGSSTLIFTLPVGYRPRNMLHFPAATSFGAYSFIIIETTGAVTSPASVSPIYFHNVHFTTS